MNQSEMLTSHFVVLFMHYFILFLIIQLTMDDVLSESCFAFIKKYKKNDFQKHQVFIKYHYFCYLQYLVSEDTEKNSQRLRNDLI